MAVAQHPPRRLRRLTPSQNTQIYEGTNQIQGMVIAKKLGM
jgi:alkylation response protein AidB-like acyl-CoA dehydrogenase